MGSVTSCSRAPPPKAVVPVIVEDESRAQLMNSLKVKETVLIETQPQQSGTCSLMCCCCSCCCSMVIIVVLCTLAFLSLNPPGLVNIKSRLVQPGMAMQAGNNGSHLTVGYPGNMNMGGTFNDYFGLWWMEFKDQKPADLSMVYSHAFTQPKDKGSLTYPREYEAPSWYKKTSAFTDTWKGRMYMWLQAWAMDDPTQPSKMTMLNATFFKVENHGFKCWNVKSSVDRDLIVHYEKDPTVTPDAKKLGTSFRILDGNGGVTRHWEEYRNAMYKTNLIFWDTNSECLRRFNTGPFNIFAYFPMKQLCPKGKGD